MGRIRACIAAMLFPIFGVVIAGAPPALAQEAKPNVVPRVAPVAPARIHIPLAHVATARPVAAISISPHVPAPEPAQAVRSAGTLVGATGINGGDTAWMLTSTALILLMTIPGLALFYAGMVRRKNVLDTMAHSFVTTCVVTLLWIVAGYSLAFTAGSPFLGGLDRWMLNGMTYLKDTNQVTVHALAPTVPESVFMMFQMTFAIITPALITGAFAERMKFSMMIVFTILWSLLVYVPVAHWVWAPGGWLAARGVLDFAGGTVVHINAGISGLVAAIVVGPRSGYRRIQMSPHNLSLTVIGASLLWVGWFGFNAGSAGAADGRAGMAMTVTQVATATAALAWMVAEWAVRGRPSVLGLVSGAVAGLVSITPASGFVDIGGALAIGAAGGVACFLAATSIKGFFNYDDSLDVFGVHAVGGVVGALLTGVFAVKAIGGAQGNLATQALGAGVTIVYAGVMTALILVVLKILFGLRVTQAEEDIGLDEIEHGERVSAAAGAA
jgi:Amt family ammonium transporter